MLRRSLTVVIPMLLLASVAAAEEDVAALKARIAELERDNARLRAEIAAMKGDLDQTQTQLAQARSENTELQARQEQQAEQRQAMYIVSQYEPTSKSSRLVSRSLRLPVTHGSRAEHELQLTAVGAGDDPTVTLAMTAKGSGRDYNTTEALALNVDGRPMSLRVADYHRDARVTGSSRNRVDRSDEYLTLSMTMEQVRQIGRATSVTAQAGHVRFAFSNDLIRMFSAAAESVDGG